MEFIFKLGFSGRLAELELASVLGFAPETKGSGEFLVELPNLPSLNSTANRMGGLIEVRFADSGKVVWRHSARYWQKMDRGKPYLVPSKGLLPPKIARQMVNLAIGKELDPNKSLLDPFCGSGTILMEAAHLGLRVVGADIDKQQLAGSEKNLEWVKAKYKLVFADAANISQHLNESVDFIVTEPFMGKTKFQVDEIDNITKGLSKLYLGALKDWQKILAPEGIVVMAFPVFNPKRKKIVTGDIVDHPSLSGYNVRVRGIFYSQPHAQIEREIIVLEKK